MSNVTDIEENMPHMVIIGLNGDAHCIPIITLERMAGGKLPLIHEGQEAIDLDMLGGVLREWLDIKRGGE